MAVLWFGGGLVSWLSNLVVCGFDSACLVCFRILNLLASLLRFWFRSLFCVSCWALVMLWFVPLCNLLWFAWWLCVLLLQPWLGLVLLDFVLLLGCLIACGIVLIVCDFRSAI